MTNSKPLLYIQALFLFICFGGKAAHDLDPLEPRQGSRQRRSVVTLYQMISCATPCEPFSYKGYGCFCGFMGNGYPVDDIDKCCQQHDKCYSQAPTCSSGMHYFTSYDFRCNYGNPICLGGRGVLGPTVDCGSHLCQCDLAFVNCLKKNRCPTTRPICRHSPWRYLQNRIIGAISGSGSY